MCLAAEASQATAVIEHLDVKHVDSKTAGGKTLFAAAQVCATALVLTHHERMACGTRLIGPTVRRRSVRSLPPKLPGLRRRRATRH